MRRYEKDIAKRIALVTALASVYAPRCAPPSHMTTLGLVDCILGPKVNTRTLNHFQNGDSVNLGTAIFKREGGKLVFVHTATDENVKVKQLQNNQIVFHAGYDNTIFSSLGATVTGTLKNDPGDNNESMSLELTSACDNI